jgi:cell division protein FtsL
MLRGVVYVLIIVHLLVLIGWLVYACPTMFKTNNELSKERLDKLNKEKLT